MNLKKILLSFICCAVVFCVLLCTGCNDQFPFQQDESEIASIEIVSIKHSETETPNEVIIVNIKDIEGIMKDFSQIEVDSIAPPYRYSQVFRTPTAIKITYNDGDREWISPNGTVVYRHQEGYSLFYGANTLNDDQFAALIEKYVGDSPVELEYNFLFSEKDISSVDIVKVGSFENSYTIPDEQILIGKCDNIDDFLNKLAKVSCFLNVKKTTRVQDNSTVFKINYKDGSYELIGACGQSRFPGFSAVFEGYRYFDEQQFNDLINSYIE